MHAKIKCGITFRTNFQQIPVITSFVAEASGRLGI